MGVYGHARPPGELQPLSREERLTIQFYEWERRGRGWALWDYPVSLEPPFQPFRGHVIPAQAVDDARKATFLSSLVERIERRAHGISPAHSVNVLPESVEEHPEPFYNDVPLVELQVSVPRTVKISAEMTEQFLLAATYASHPLSFEVVGLHDSVIVQLVCREPDYFQLRQQLRAFFPAAVLRETPAFLETQWADTRESTAVVDFGLSDEFMLPVRTVRGFDVDPLIGVVGALSELGEGELGLVQVLFERATFPWAKSILRSVTSGDGTSFFVDAPEILTLAKEKVARPLYAAVIRVAAKSGTDARAWQLVKGLSAALTAFSRPGSNELMPLTNDAYDDLDHETAVLARESYRSGMILNSDELLSLVHLPSLSVASERLKRQDTRTKAAPRAARDHALVLGENTHNGETHRVTLSVDQRIKHTHIIGVSGSGKSTLLLNMIVQDVRQGNGICVLDPHGDLIDQILSHIPEERIPDVVLLDPADAEYPIGFNILSAHSELEKNLLSSDLAAVFRRLSTSWGDQMTSVLGNAILAFLESNVGGTLADLRRFLIEADFRRDFLRTVQDPQVVYYWQKEFPLLAGKPQAPLLTRLDIFLRPKLIRNMVTQRENRLDFQRIMNEQKILLAKLSQGAIGEENAFLLGTLLVSKLHQMVLGRQEVEAARRPPFYLYFDEFQNFVTPSMASILSGARKYHLGLVLAHQEFRQLWNKDQDVASAVIANPCTRICFRLGDFDASKLADGFSAFGASDLQNLGVGEAIVRIERNEHDFNLRTFPLPEVDAATAERRRAASVAFSRERYGTKRQSTRAYTAVSQDPEAPPLSKPTSEAPEKEAHIPQTDRRSTELAFDRPVPPPTLGRGGQQHKYLQHLIKHLAEDRGYRVVIEDPVLAGVGSVDVSLERNGRRIACEISVSSTAEYEVKSIHKCLAAGFDQVIVLSSDKRTLATIKKLAAATFDAATHERLLFFLPEELVAYLEEGDKEPVNTENTVHGYRVRVKYNALSATDVLAQRAAITQVIVQALKRLKDER